MGESKFRVGDRVRALKTVDGEYLSGHTATVICVGEECQGRFEVGVEFDNNISGHTCQGRGADGKCRWGYEKEFVLVSRPLFALKVKR